MARKQHFEKGDKVFVRSLFIPRPHESFDSTVVDVREGRDFALVMIEDKNGIVGEMPDYELGLRA